MSLQKSWYIATCYEKAVQLILLAYPHGCMFDLDEDGVVDFTCAIEPLHILSKSSTQTLAAMASNVKTKGFSSTVFRGFFRVPLRASTTSVDFHIE